VSAQCKRDLWRDYDQEWKGIAETFAVTIDQWYRAIGDANPNSVYWNSRAASPDLGIQEASFEGLLNTAVSPITLLAMLAGENRTNGQYFSGGERRYEALLDAAAPEEPSDHATIALADGATIRPSLALDVPGFKAVVPPPPFELAPSAREAVATYWDDPQRNGDAVAAPHTNAVICQRFAFTDDADGPQVRSLEPRDGGPALWRLLEQGPTSYGELRDKLSVRQRLLLRRLLGAGLVSASSEPAALASSIPAAGSATAASAAGSDNRIATGLDNAAEPDGWTAGCGP
jgi:hypothetical protein